MVTQWVTQCPSTHWAKVRGGASGRCRDRCNDWMNGGVIRVCRQERQGRPAIIRGRVAPGSTDVCPASGFLLLLEHTCTSPSLGLCTWCWLLLDSSSHTPASICPHFFQVSASRCLLWEGSQITRAPRAAPPVLSPPCLTLLWFNSYSTSPPEGTPIDLFISPTSLIPEGQGSVYSVHGMSPASPHVPGTGPSASLC